MIRPLLGCVQRDRSQVHRHGDRAGLVADGEMGDCRAGARRNHQAERNAMSELTRRRFVTTSAGAAAGMTAIGALVAGQADADAEVPEGNPVVAYVTDARKGEISVM